MSKLADHIYEAVRDAISAIPSEKREDIYVLCDSGIATTAYEETEQYELTHSVLADRERFLHYLFTEE